MSADGLWFRVAVLIVGALQVMIAALLGFSEYLAFEWKIVLTVLSAGLVFVANQLPSLQNAPIADRALKRAAAEKPPL